MIITCSLGGIRAQEEMRFDKALHKNTRLIAILFCRPELDVMKTEIVPSLPYFHFRSGGNTAFYFAGFVERDDSEPDEQDAAVIGGRWLFDPASFNHFRGDIGISTKWRYSGGCDMILVNSHRNSGIDFTSAMVLRLDKIREFEATPTITQLFEAIFQYATLIPPAD